ncbi:MAG: hypothetical protein ABSE27_02690 [Acidobacteriaceae bacterium]|jgi:hypothetical protein
MEPTKRLSPLRPLHIAAIQVSLCVIVVIARVVFVYGSTFWNNATAFNFIAAWIPAVIGVVVAFVPERDLEHHIRIRWRYTIAGVLFLWSVSLWRQQTLSAIESSQQITTAITQAVAKANDHSDSKFAGVNQQVGTLENKLEGVNRQQIALDNDFAKATGDINTNLGKVGKPEPPPLASLQFSLWRDEMSNSDIPLETVATQPDADGNFPVSILVRNASTVSAEGVEIWVEVCKACIFAKDPEGFDKPNGNNERTRHIIFHDINPGVSVVKNISVKVNVPAAPRFVVGVTGSCKNCGGATTEKALTVDITPQ